MRSPLINSPLTFARLSRAIRRFAWREIDSECGTPRGHCLRPVQVAVCKSPIDSGFGDGLRGFIRRAPIIGNCHRSMGQWESLQQFMTWIGAKWFMHTCNRFHMVYMGIFFFNFWRVNCCANPTCKGIYEMFNDKLKNFYTYANIYLDVISSCLDAF